MSRRRTTKSAAPPAPTRARSLHSPQAPEFTPIPTVDQPHQARFLSAGGEMGERMRHLDWSATSLGRIESWPQSLKTAVRIMLTSRQPMFVWWGDELINLYNDAYRSIVGGKHPHALGQPAAWVWREIWDQVGPRAASAMRRNEGTYDESLLLIMERNGYREETYYTFSYSPVPNDDGGTGGIICANTDETQRIIGERELALLRDVAARAAHARDWREACRLSAAALAGDPRDLPFALVYLIDPDSPAAVLGGAIGAAAESAVAPARIAPGEGALWPIHEVAQQQSPQILDRLSDRVAELPCGAWDRPPQRAVVLPIAPGSAGGLAGALVVGLNPYRQYDDRYHGFLDLVTGQISASLANAQAYAQERRRAEALAELDRAKTTFFSNVSHEFRTPLTLILGPLEDMLASGNGHLPPEFRGQTETMHRNSLRLLKLVNTLLDFSRIEAGRLQARYAPTDLATLTGELASCFRSACERSGLELVVDCPPLPEPVHVDRSMWEKIVLNLLSNAFKFTLAGSIRVSVEPRGDAVELAVRDTGTGIPNDALPRLFERFFRVEGAAGRTQEGSGIGLALVQELVRLHGGSVAVESAPDEGSTFTVRIPRGTAHLPAESIVTGGENGSATAGEAFVAEALRWLPEAPRDMLPLAGERPTPDSTRSTGNELRAPSRVLLADDNADMRDYVRRLLSEHYEVVAVADGNAALAEARARRPDLVLSDVMMPGLDGFALLQAMRGDEQLAGVPFIMLSARAGEDAKVEGLDAGADDYLVKPFSARELLARVGANLELARVRSAALRQEQALRGEAEKLNEVARGLNAELDLQKVLQQMTDVGVDLTGAQFGAFFYNAVGDDGESYLLYTLAGAATEQFDGLGMPRNTPLFAPTFRGEGPVRIADVLQDPRYGQNAPHRGMPEGHLSVRSYLAVPVVARSGEVLGGLFFGHPEPGVFSLRAERLALGLAAQSAVAIDNARLYGQAKREIEERQRAVQALAESEARFRTVATNAPAAIYIKDLDGRYVLANPLACTALGRPDGVIGLTDHEILPEDIADALRVHDLEVIRTGKPLEREELIGPAAAPRDFLSVKFPLFDSANRPAGVCGVSVDITDRKRSERELRESEQRYRQLVKVLPAAVYTCDALGRVRLYNDAATELWGRAPRIGEEWWCGSQRIFRTDGSPLPLHQCPMAVALKEGRPVRDEEIIVERPDGSRRHVLPHPEPIFDGSGRLVGAVNMLLDVTEQRRAEESQARLAAIVSSTTDAVVSKTLDGIITSWNAGAEQTFGYSAAEAIGRSIRMIIPDELQPEEDEILARLRRGERIEHYETVRMAKGGRRVDVSITISPLRDPRGGVIGAAKVARDITARRRAEAELAAAKDDLALQVAALQRLHELSLTLASSTDLEANLTAILGAAVELHGAAMGCISLVDAASGELTLGPVMGFDAQALADSTVAAQRAGSCALALRTRQRVVVEDFERDERFVEFRPVALAAGFRAAHSTPILDRSGKVLGVLAVQFAEPHAPTARERQFADMCARYAHETIETARHQQELRASEQRFRSMADTAPAMLWVTESDGSCTFQSRAWYEYTGQAQSSALGYGWLGAVHPDDRAKAHEAFMAANAQHRPFAFDYRLRRFDGEYRWIIDAGHPRFDAEGVFLGYIGSVIDIHDRKQTEDALRDSEEKFRDLADNMSQFAWMTDAAGWIFWYNQRWFEYTGTTLEEMQGWGWMAVHHPDHVERVVEKFKACIQAGEPWEDTFPLRGTDGQYRWFLSRALPIRDAAGNIVRWFGTNTDITERKEAEQQLRFVMAELNHRVKNTLATIDAVAHQTLRHSASLDEFQTAFSQRLRALGHAHSLLTQTHWEGASLHDLIHRELKSRCGHDGQMRIQGPQVTLRPKAALALHMVIHELCTNAAKYGALRSDAGRVEVAWSIRPGLRHDELHLRWTESGGPPVSPPTKRGFGSRVLESTIAYELEGELELEFRSTGLVCVIVFPLREESGFGRKAHPDGENAGTVSRSTHA